MEYNSAFVSIIIPCRNEEKFITKCLDSILEQDYPKDKLEVLVIDGMSEDKTRSIIKGYTDKHMYVKVLDNVKKSTPYAMNLGIKNSKGDIIVKMDAHTVYDNNYISNCVRYLKEYKADNVGGILKTIPDQDNLIAQAVAMVLSHPFGVGNSYFRTGIKTPKWVDTVAFGCYRREVFEKVGLYNEGLARGQDIELNLRLKKNGGKILLHPEIIGYYFIKSNLGNFCRHNFINGLWAILPFKFSSTIPISLRHLVPLLFTLSLLGFGGLSIFTSFSIFRYLLLLITSLYLLLNLFFSCQIVIKKKNPMYIFIMPVMFTLFHLSYGSGSLWGVLRVSISKRFWKNLKNMFAKIDYSTINRKSLEAEHYNKLAEKVNPNEYNWKSGSEQLNPALRAPYKFSEEWLSSQCPDKVVLDYGCGCAIFSIFPAKHEAKVYAVDISSKSLEIAKERAIRENVGNKIIFQISDCEHLDFPDNYFDIIMSYRTLSCLDLKKAYSEMSRICKPDGKVIVIDALGYNPILNINRKFNYIKGRRTLYTLDHILKKSSINLARKYFKSVDYIRFFDLTTLMIAPLLKNKKDIPKYISSLIVILTSIDKIILKLPLIKYLAFKVVIILSDPIK